MEEWLAVVAICSVPFVIYALLELRAKQKSRRIERLARRSKAQR